MTHSQDQAATPLALPPGGRAPRFDTLPQAIPRKLPSSPRDGKLGNPPSGGASILRGVVLHPGNTPLGNDPEWFKIARFYPEMCLNGVNTQWVYSQGVRQKPFDPCSAGVTTSNKKCRKREATRWSQRFLHFTTLGMGWQQTDLFLAAPEPKHEQNPQNGKSKHAKNHEARGVPLTRLPFLDSLSIFHASGAVTRSASEHLPSSCTAAFGAKPQMAMAENRFGIHWLCRCTTHFEATVQSQ